MTNIRVADGLSWQVQGFAKRTTARDPILWPFTTNSVWNLPVSNDATFADVTDAATVSMRSATYTSYINYYQYTHPIYYASYDDPAASMTDTSSGSRSGAYYIPTTATASVGTDGHMHVMHPSGRFIDEAIGMSRTDNATYKCTRHQRVDLYGNGLGPQNGVRAYGGSAIGGLIRDWETDPSHPNYTGSFQHALAFALDPAQQYYSGGTFSYTTTGYCNSLGYVWPATEQDYSANSAYKGNCPMGAYFAIPSTVDITTLGLTTPQGMMLAKACQDYGAYDTDTTYGNMAFYVEPLAHAKSFANVLVNKRSEIDKVRNALRRVTNNAVDTPNGGSLTSTRRVALAPELPA